MSLTRELISQQLAKVTHPGLGRDIILLGMVRNIASCDEYVSIRLQMEAGGMDHAPALEGEIRRVIRELDPDLKQINIEILPTEGEAAGAGVGGSGAAEKQADGRPRAAEAFAKGGESADAGGGQARKVKLPQQPKAEPAPEVNTGRNTPLPNVRRVIAVGAGKGGVGKSTVAVNLAVGLARRGYRVGLLDGDIYGPSVPTLMGLAKLRVMGTQQMMEPFEVHGIKTMTIGKLVDPEKPLIWRGPMAHSAFRQLTTQTNWGVLDYLVIDLPPGTGDVPLSLAQMLPLDGAVIVCTPQKVAQDDAVRAIAMFRQLNVPVLGVVENMSYFIGDDGKVYDLFGRGGAAAMAEKHDLPLLGTIPIHMVLRENSDAGNPTGNFTSNEGLARELNEMAGNVVRQVEGTAADAPAQPTLSVK